jgi:hypothetical protein
MKINVAFDVIGKLKGACSHLPLRQCLLLKTIPEFEFFVIAAKCQSES